MDVNVKWATKRWLSAVGRRVNMIYVQGYTDEWPNSLSIEKRTQKTALHYLIHVINSRLVTLRFTSPLPPSQT